jgi:hypothetical protein
MHVNYGRPSIATVIAPDPLSRQMSDCHQYFMVWGWLRDGQRNTEGVNMYLRTLGTPKVAGKSIQKSRRLLVSSLILKTWRSTKGLGYYTTIVYRNTTSVWRKQQIKQDEMDVSGEHKVISQIRFIIHSFSNIL